MSSVVMLFSKGNVTSIWDRSGVPTFITKVEGDCERRIGAL